MPFKPNDYVLDQLITLIELWKDRANNPLSRLSDSMPTKKFLGMIKSAPSIELFIKYWENVPALQQMLEKPNFDEIKLASEESQEPPDVDADTPEDSLDAATDIETPTDHPLGNELPTLDDVESSPIDSGQTVAPSASSAPLSPAPSGPNPRDIVSQMATRRKNRVMEAQRRLRNTGKLLR